MSTKKAGPIEVREMVVLEDPASLDPIYAGQGYDEVLGRLIEHYGEMKLYVQGLEDPPFTCTCVAADTAGHTPHADDCALVINKERVLQGRLLKLRRPDTTDLIDPATGQPALLPSFLFRRR